MRGLRVDLSELEETVRKLGRLTTAMGDSVTKSRYSTYLPAGALGRGFIEQEELHVAHSEMKAEVEEIIEALEELIEDFGTKTKQVHGKYQDADHDAKYRIDGERDPSGSGH